MAATSVKWGHIQVLVLLVILGVVQPAKDDTPHTSSHSHKHHHSDSDLHHHAKVDDMDEDEEDELHHHLLDEEEDIPLTEEMVLQHQGHYGTLWKEHINNGDTQHCGDSYTNDAVLQVTVLPSVTLTKALKKLLGPLGKLVLRGKKNITKFWKTAMFLGLSDWVDYNVADEIGSTNLVLSDDEVLLSGLFETSKFKGQVVAEYWFRYNKEWRMRSQVIEIRENKDESTDKHEEVNTVSDVHPVVEAEHPAEPAVTTDAKADIEQVEKEPANEEVPEKVTSESDDDDDDDDETDESAPQGMSKSVLFMIALLSCAILAFLVRHSKRRSASTIGGFESMLG